MPNDHCYWFVCFAPLKANVPQIFGFEEFLTGLALMVLAWTIADVVYRFRIKTAPIPLIEITFGITAVIGVLTLLTDVWRAEQWFVPIGILLTPATWQAVLGGVFVLTFFTWGWFAIVRPARFGRQNAKRYAQALYSAILRGSSTELPIVAQELSRSVKSLIHHSTDVRELETQPKDDGKARQLPRATEVANEILLLIGHPRFCRAVVEAAPAAAWAVFAEIADAKKYGVQVGVFARNILNEALANKNSFLFHETDGYESGLIGIHQPLSQAMFGNYEMVAEIPLMLDVDWKARSRWDEEQWTAYCRVVLIAMRGFLDQGHRGQSSVLYSAMRVIEEATGDLYTLDGTAVGWSGAEPLDRLHAAMRFIQDAIEMLGKREVSVDVKLPIDETRQRWTIYDDVAELIQKVIHHAAYVKQPTDLCWSVQYVSVWSPVFRDYDSSRALRIIQHKVCRLVFDDLSDMSRYPNYEGARVLAFCLNVMGLRVSREKSYRETRALHTAILRWTTKNYERIHAYDTRIAEMCLPDGMSYDEEHHRLVKIHLSGMRRTPVRTELQMAAVESDNTDSASTKMDEEPTQ